MIRLGYMNMMQKTGVNRVSYLKKVNQDQKSKVENEAFDGFIFFDKN